MANNSCCGDYNVPVNPIFESDIRLGIIGDCVLCINVGCDSGQIDLTQAIRNCETKTNLTLSGSGDNKELCYNNEAGQQQCFNICDDIVGCVSLRCLKDVCDTTPKDGDVLTYSTADSQWCGAPLEVDACDIVNITEASDDSSDVLVCQDGCIKKIPCEGDDVMLVKRNGVWVCECAPYQKVKQLDEGCFDVATGGTPGNFQGPGTPNTAGNGNQVQMGNTKVITNDTDCPQKVQLDVPFTACVVPTSTPFEVVINAWFRSTGGTLLNGQAIGGNYTEHQLAHVNGQALPSSGFVTGSGTCTLCVKLQPGQSTTITYGVTYHIYDGTFGDIIAQNGFDDAVVGNGGGIVPPTLTVSKCD